MKRDLPIQAIVIEEMTVKTMIRKIAVMTFSLALIANTGCTSLQTIETTEAAVVEHKLKVGDKVRLRRVGHRTEDVYIWKLSESELTATREDGTVIVVEWREILTLKVVKISPVKTAGAGVGLVVFAVVVLAIWIYIETGIAPGEL